jgi:RHS repeat-associated protein
MTTNFNVIVSDQPITTVGYIYDAAGNVTYDGVHSYQYDAENRTSSADNGATGSYAFDYQNRRIKRSTSSAAIHYIWEGSHVLAEHNAGTRAQIVDYVYAGSRLIGEGPGNILGGNGTFTYLLSDRLSTRVGLDRYANVLGRQATLPFGEEFGETGTQEKHHFTSYESDGETGTDYAVNREHAQSVGRFMRVDPISGSVGDPQSLNRYSYVRNDSINGADPFGLEWRCVCGHEDDPESPLGGESSGGPTGFFCDCIWVNEGGGGGSQRADCAKKLDDVLDKFKKAEQAAGKLFKLAGDAASDAAARFNKDLNQYMSDLAEARAAGDDDAVNLIRDGAEVWFKSSGRQMSRFFTGDQIDQARSLARAGENA